MTWKGNKEDRELEYLSEKLEDMYKEISTFTDDVSFELREMLFKQYNEYSQITHGDLFQWTNKSLKFSTNDTILVFSTIKRIILLPYLICKDNGMVVNETMLMALKSELDKIDKILLEDKND